MDNRYTKDGGIIPSHVPIMSEEKAGEQRVSLFGLYRGYIQRAVFPDNSENVTGQLEYVVNINGQNFSGVLDGQKRSGGIFENDRRVRQGVEAVDPADIGLALGDVNRVPNDKKDGESVWVLFTEGDTDFPVIIGSDEHARVEENPDYPKPVTADGKHDRFEFNGLEFQIDKDSNLSITHLGRKKFVGGLTPVIENPEATEPNPSKIEFRGNGDFIADINDSLCRFSLIKADAKAELELGGGLKILWDGTNDKYVLETATGAKVTLDGPNDKFSWVSPIGTKIEGDGINDKVSAEVAFGDKLSVSAADGIQGETPTGVKLSMKSGAAELEGSGGKIKLIGGKVAMGAAGPAEIMEQFSQLLTQLGTLLSSMQIETHVGNLGYNTSPPLTAPAYAAVATSITAIQTVINGIKGTL